MTMKEGFRRQAEAGQLLRPLLHHLERQEQQERMRRKEKEGGGGREGIS